MGAAPAEPITIARTLASAVQLVVDRAAIVAHLRRQLGRLDDEARRELGDWVAALDSEGEQQAEAIVRVSAAIAVNRRWEWGEGFVYGLAVPFQTRRAA